MKKIILFILILFYSTFAQKLNIPEFKDFKLDNGLKIVLVKDSKLPLIQFRLLMNGGIRLDPLGYDGLTSITAELLRKGTETKNTKQISEMFESLGSSLNINTSYDFVSMSSEFLKEKFNSGIKIISDLILNPTFPEAEIEKEIKKRIANIDASLEE
ncbi:MAG: insulinase family protein, partial [Ignavibacteria bacterium]|nr:insulinase family protein [Ignavibacteria bacterium]